MPYFIWHMKYGICRFFSSLASPARIFQDESVPRAPQ
jgi:hypothetical protein